MWTVARVKVAEIFVEAAIFLVCYHTVFGYCRGALAVALIAAIKLRFQLTGKPKLYAVPSICFLTSFYDNRYHH